MSLLQSGERVVRLDDLQDIDELHVVEVLDAPCRSAVHHQQFCDATQLAVTPFKVVTCSLTQCNVVCLMPTGDGSVVSVAAASRLLRLHPSAPRPSPAEATAATPAPCPRRGAGPMAVCSSCAADVAHTCACTGTCRIPVQFSRPVECTPDQGNVALHHAPAALPERVQRRVWACGPLVASDLNAIGCGCRCRPSTRQRRRRQQCRAIQTGERRCILFGSRGLPACKCFAVHAIHNILYSVRAFISQRQSGPGWPILCMHGFGRVDQRCTFPEPCPMPFSRISGTGSAWRMRRSGRWALMAPTTTQTTTPNTSSASPRCSAASSASSRPPSSRRCRSQRGTPHRPTAPQWLLMPAMRGL